MLTVLIPTFNGAETLPSVLGRYTLLQPPNGGWKLLVIDNASTDDTPSILRGFVDKLPLQIERIEQRGKNIALNAGLRHVVGDLVVLSDDDTLPAANWLARIRAAADERQAFDLFGGRIEPVWPGEPPAWILRLVNLGATFGLTPDRVESGPTEAARIWGANMAVRRRVFDNGHRFDEDVGPAAGQYVMGSEVEFGKRVERLGHRAWFVADAVVGHIIRAQQLQREWIIGRAYRLGKHMYQQEQPTFGPEVPLIRGAPRWKYREALNIIAKLFGSAVTLDADRRFLAAWEWSFLRGYFAEASHRSSDIPSGVR